jgi:hypothetical protein
VPDPFELEVRAVDADVAGGPDGTVDVIDSGRPPRRLWSGPGWFERFGRLPVAVLLAVIVAGLGIAAGVSLLHPDRTPAPTQPAVVLNGYQQEVLAVMIAAAQSTDALHDSLTPSNTVDTCPLSTADAAKAVITRTIAGYQPGFRLRDSDAATGRTGLCSAQLRLSGPDGVTMLVTVTAPSTTASPDTVFQAGPSNTGPSNTGPPAAGSSADATPVAIFDNQGDALDVMTTVQGWRIEVGEVGRPGHLLAQSALVSIATDARLRW